MGNGIVSSRACGSWEPARRRSGGVQLPRGAHVTLTGDGWVARHGLRTPCRGGGCARAHVSVHAHSSVSARAAARAGAAVIQPARAGTPPMRARSAAHQPRRRGSRAGGGPRGRGAQRSSTPRRRQGVRLSLRGSAHWRLATPLCTPRRASAGQAQASGPRARVRRTGCSRGGRSAASGEFTPPGPAEGAPTRARAQFLAL